MSYEYEKLPPMGHEARLVAQRPDGYSVAETVHKPTLHEPIQVDGRKTTRFEDLERRYEGDDWKLTPTVHAGGEISAAALDVIIPPEDDAETAETLEAEKPTVIGVRVIESTVQVPVSHGETGSYEEPMER